MILEPWKKRKFSATQCVTGTLMVEKNYNDLQFCWNFCPKKEDTIQYTLPLPRNDGILSRLGKARVYNEIDLQTHSNKPKNRFHLWTGLIPTTTYATEKGAQELKTLVETAWTFYFLHVIYCCQQHLLWFSKTLTETFMRKYLPVVFDF